LGWGGIAEHGREAELQELYVSWSLLGAGTQKWFEGEGDTVKGRAIPLSNKPAENLLIGDYSVRKEDHYLGVN